MDCRSTFNVPPSPFAANRRLAVRGLKDSRERVPAARSSSAVRQYEGPSSTRYQPVFGGSPSQVHRFTFRLPGDV